ncbi:MAG TPA: DegT/DnrJ/EryC1/StrS family aminotransferase [Candidatus Limnocylindrales bacterium]|nr:DegT/DnrJ/EryC1/StrS family aminotransferase [Candidatus Limnocylindrales bacterium]
MRARIPFLEPDLPDAAPLAEDMQRIVASARLSNGGPFEESLCDRIAARVGAAHCIAVANATIGLMLAMRATARPGATLAVMPSFTFPATALAARWAGLEPLFCDIDERTWQPRVPIESLRPFADSIALLVPCNTFGAPCDIEQWIEIAEDLGVPLLVDSAAGLGGRYRDGRAIGGAGATEVFSMHATKSFGVGEGGLVVTADAALAARLRTMRNFGLGEDGVCVEPGLNGKLSELHAAVACRVLDGFDAALQRRAAIAERYRRRLAPLAVQLQDGAELSPCQAASIRLRGADRGLVRERLLREGVETRHYFSPPLHRQPLFASCRALGALEGTTAVAADILALPMSTRRTDEEIDRICDALARCL